MSVSQKNLKINRDLSSMAITKGKMNRRGTVPRGNQRLRSAQKKISTKQTLKGKQARLKPGSNLRSSPVAVSNAPSSQTRLKSRSHPRKAERPAKRSASWEIQKWLIGKKLAHVVKEKLIADFRNENARPAEQKARKQRRRR